MTVTPAARRLGAVMLATALALVAAGAAGAAAPAVTTGPVTTIGPTSATATGKVVPNGLATTWYVEYGTSTSYGSRTDSKSAGSGTASVDVSVSIERLTPATTYHYRLVATSSGGLTRGADGIFTTAAPPGVVTGAAADVTTTSARLDGTVDPNGRATTWHFEYGTSTSYGSVTSDRSAGSGTSAAGVSASISGLAPGRTYHFRLVATSDAGTTRGADRTFTTGGMPVAVTGTASSIAPTSARLNGSVTPNGRSTTWWFEYGTSTSYGSKTSQHDVGSGTARIDVSATLTQLAVATTYHYRLVAKNDAGTSLGGDRTFSTSLPPGVTTGIPRDVAHASATATGAVDPRGRKTTWYFEYGTSTAYGARTSSKSAGSGKAVPVTAPLSKLSPATTYHYRLVATSDAGTSRGSDVSFTTTGVTLAAPALQVFYGRSVALFGTVPTKLAGERVTIFAQRFGEGSFQSVATVLTGASGTWTLLVSPRIQTAYRASWNDGLSAATTIGVHPGISLRVTAARRLATHVAGTHSFAGRFVKLQRRSASGRWVTVARARLGLRSSAVFRVDLPTGASTLRVAMSVNQAGAGYLGGVSRTLVYHRR